MANNIKDKAKDEGVEIRFYDIIYKAVEEMESAMKGMLDPEFEEKVIGTADIRQIFKFSKVGNIAGSSVSDGIIKRDWLNWACHRLRCSIYSGKNNEELIEFCTCFHFRFTWL